MNLLRLMVASSVILAVANRLDCLYSRRCHKRVDNKIDDALADTYPASDPPSSQFFGIPANRL